MTRYLLPRILLPILLLCGVELSFRLGAWETIASRESHSGTSIRAREALEAHAGRIDFITLGSSRAEYGLDHTLIHGHAKSRGAVHLNLSQPGSHWLSITTISAYVREHHPELKGGILGLSYLDVQNVVNGTYELAITQPFRPVFRQPDLYALQFNRNDPTSYGTWSALLAYRQDIRSFLENPSRRFKANAWWSENKPWRFDENPETNRDVCSLPWNSIAECQQTLPTTDAGRNFQASCNTFQPNAPRIDWSTLTDPLPPDRAETKRILQQAIRNLGWPTPPVIVLLPTTHHWRDTIAPIGAEAWAKRILQPLADAGEIVLIDRTTSMDENGKTRCDVFIDLYHQNGKGANEVTRTLLGDLDTHLYSSSPN